MQRAEIAAKSVWRSVYAEGWALGPVDLTKVARRLGVTLIRWEPDEPKLNGALIRSEGAVFINALLPETRARFTAAHELGHYVLGHSGDYYCYEGLRTPQERKASAFAAALLMPAPVVKALWLRLGATPPAAKVAAASRALGVSRQAFGYRLVTLGLVRRAAPTTATA